jgi:hypothetical protein
LRHQAQKIHKCNRLIGFLEAVYQEALEIELKKAEIPYERENNQSYSLIHPCPSVVILKSELLIGAHAKLRGCQKRAPALLRLFPTGGIYRGPRHATSAP